MAAGNQPPTVGIDLVGGNSTFFFPGVPVRYAVRVTDREDGTLRGGRIPTRRVAVRAQYLPGGVEAASPGGQGRQLIEAGDCLSRPPLNRKSIGPADQAVAGEDPADTPASARPSKKIPAR